MSISTTRFLTQFRPACCCFRIYSSSCRMLRRLFPLMRLMSGMQRHGAALQRARTMPANRAPTKTELPCVVMGGKQRSAPAQIEIYNSPTSKSSQRKYVLRQRGQNIYAFRPCHTLCLVLYFICVGNLVLGCHVVCS